ncbi:MAG: carboxymuconolactone decarboxylase family protein [Planctomycetes bacterium]|nr:carboxymuconolactone decarboxylase family protein [Planctomycetota bacterium]
MSRLTLVDPKTATGQVKEIFEGPLKGKYINIFRAMANSPAGLQFYVNMQAAIAGSPLTPKEREVIALALAELNLCEYCVAAHTMVGKAAGLTVEQTVAARKGTSDDPKLAALARFATRIHEKKGFVTDAEVAEFKAAGYAESVLVDVVAVIALNIYTNLFNHVNNTPVDFPAPPPLK